MRLQQSMMVLSCLAALLTGCGTSVISSNPRQVIVESQMLDTGEAQRLADAECGKHRRYAMLAIKGDYWERSYTFECTE